MEKEVILVVGYPKSGNTWLTRLVADLLMCPVKGFFEKPQHLDLAIEGLNRESEFIVYKAHQTFEQVDKKVKKKNIIYIVRDVRDIAISGAHYFATYPSKNFVSNIVCKIPFAGKIGSGSKLLLGVNI